MDDTTLISSSIEGLTAMLTTAQKFYNMNNTKINFNKAFLICNKDPCDPSRNIEYTTAPHRFLSHNIDFACTPLAKDTSFHFLGVWFTLTPNNKIVKKQCKTEYYLFSNKLHNKKLTSDQLKYLHNAVLLPKVSYRLKCTTFNESECSTIVKPFRNILKKSLHLVSLIQISISANIPSSLLLVRKFTTLSKLKSAKTDYFFNFLILSTSLGITFSRPLRSSQSVDATTIFSLFHDNSSLYASSLHIVLRTVRTEPLCYTK